MVYVDLVKNLSREVKNARQDSEDAERKINDCDPKLNELSRSEQLPADESTMVAMSRNHEVLDTELDVKRVAGHWCARIMPDFVGRVCIGYSGLMRMYVASRRNWLNTLLVSAQLKQEYFSRSRIIICDNGYSLLVVGPSREKEQGEWLTF